MEASREVKNALKVEYVKKKIYSLETDHWGPLKQERGGGGITEPEKITLRYSWYLN